jgi:hypothetical protein
MEDKLFPLENGLSCAVKRRYSACKSGMKDLQFFKKFNFSQIAHTMEGVSLICFM